MLNRVEPAHVLGGFKMFKRTGTHREYPGRLSNTVIIREDAGSNPVSTGAIPAQSGNIRVSTVINRAVPLPMFM